MEKVVSRKSLGYRKSLGPGILLAAACIGGSHLMSSTTAGAKFGFSKSYLFIESIDFN